MKINGVDLEDIDILDLEVAEKWEQALKSVEGIEEKVKGMTVAESVRTQCNAVFNVFNELFGEGTDKKIFGDRVNLMMCLKAFEELIIAVNSKNEEVEKLSKKYSPNRVQRRVKK